MSLPGRFLSVGGLRIFYHRSGRGAPLVLVHGFLVSHYQWRHVIPALATGRDVIAFDLPGFGESDRPPATEYRYDAHAFLDTLLGLLDVLGIDRCALVGHSLGGAVALLAAARRPERVERLVVVDPLVFPVRLPPVARLALAPVVGEWLLRGALSRAVVRRVLRRGVYLDPKVASEDWVDYVWERMNRPGGMAATAATMRFVADPAAVERNVRAVRAPTLIAWGQEDRLFPPSWARRLARDMPGAQVRIIPTCGHAPPEERPDDLLAAMTPFLELPGASAPADTAAS